MDKSRFINQILPTRTYFGPKKRNSVSVVSVTIFDRRSVSPDRIHLYYISFYLQSHRFHTKHLLIYSCIREKKGIGKDDKDKVRNDQISCIQNAFNQSVTVPTSLTNSVLILPAK